MSRKASVGSLEVLAGHEGYYHFNDMKYIIRVIQKIAQKLPDYSKDIDMLQLSIESFLILNSRIYNDLAKCLIKETRVWHILPVGLYKQVLTPTHRRSLSYRYHKDAKLYRHRAAHGSNYLRIGLTDMDGILPRPLNYRSTVTPVLANMASTQDLVSMWQSDMNEVASDIEDFVGSLVTHLNQHKEAERNRETVYSDVQIQGWLEESKKLMSEYREISLKEMPDVEAHRITLEYQIKQLDLQYKYGLLKDL